MKPIWGSKNDSLGESKQTLCYDSLWFLNLTPLKLSVQGFKKVHNTSEVTMFFTIIKYEKKISSHPSRFWQMNISELKNQVYIFCGPLPDSIIWRGLSVEGVVITYITIKPTTLDLVKSSSSESAANGSFSPCKNSGCRSSWG